MKKDPGIFLRDILECCDLIIKNVQSVTLEQFQQDINLQDAVIRRFEIIGEAVKKLPEKIRAAYPYIAWKEAAGFRDVLIHDYKEIVIDEVYGTGINNLPKFRDQIQKVFEEVV